MRTAVARESLYSFRSLKEGALATFMVEDPSGQTHEELLSLTTIEARIMLWDDALQHDPSLAWRDEIRAANYRQYVQALVAALKRQL
jgi:hypothetical protein